MYTVYILYSPTANRIYIGFTSNLIERFQSHNSLSKKGWTVSGRPWIVIYCEYYEEKSTALKREKALKSGQGRAWVHEKIKNELLEQGFISA